MDLGPIQEESDFFFYLFLSFSFKNKIFPCRCRDLVNWGHKAVRANEKIK